MAVIERSRAEIVAEFETWQKIRDWEGTEGWVHQSMLSARRHVLVTGDKLQELYRRPEDAATVAAAGLWACAIIGVVLSNTRAM